MERGGNPAGHGPDRGCFARLVTEAEPGSKVAAAEILPVVYEQLRAIAAEQMKGERAGHTLQATALVNEAYLRLLGGPAVYSGRAAFFHAAAEAMRRILIEHARAKGAAKRGGGARRMPADVLDLAAARDSEEIVSFDGAIVRLEREDGLAAAVVKLRFFAGLSVEATAAALGVSERTVNREWTYARAWLYRELRETVKE